jgi:DNA-binding transcriptional regulator YhcF (GntR family)
MRSLLSLYQRLVLKHPVSTLVLVFLIALLAAMGLPNFKLDASADSLTLESDTSLDYFREINQRYQSGDFLVVTYTPHAEMFSDESIETLTALRAELEQVEGVASINSMLDVPLLYSPMRPLAEQQESVRTLLTEEMRMGMLIGVAVGWELARELERRSGVALWRQIADQIRLLAASGALEADGRLPPELALAERFGVNRHTVRSAIAQLVREGALRSEQGRGTFAVRPKRLAYPIATRTRFSTGLEGQAKERKARLLAHAEEPAEPRVAEALEIEPGAPVVRLETVIEADGRPAVAHNDRQGPG